MSMFACRYFGSSSSPYWINPITSPSSSIANVGTSASSARTSSAVCPSHQTATSGWLRMRTNGST
jgi:hypothetical protein